MNFLTNKAGSILICTLLLILSASYVNGNPITQNNPIEHQADSLNPIFMADPSILYHKGNYYLYGTAGKDGILVYTSRDMKSWVGPVGVKSGYALLKGDSFGTSDFWAPQVFYKNKKFYMAYTANENIAIAESTSPLGPFKQQILKPISGIGKQIDPYIFIDDDGNKYIYHVRLQNGNRLFVAELKDDLSDIKLETAKECIAATEPWENTANTAWPVAEGPTVLKYKNLYYLFYSANDFRNIDYAVGYSTGPTPFGPWKKSIQNPIISRHNMDKNGPGHGDFIKDKTGNLYYVFHTHRSEKEVSPRIIGIVKGHFNLDSLNEDKMVIDANSFHYLQLKK